MALTAFPDNRGVGGPANYYPGSSQDSRAGAGQTTFCFPHSIEAGLGAIAVYRTAGD